MPSVHDAAGRALSATSMTGKIAAVRAARAGWHGGSLRVGVGHPALAPGERGRPDRPELVDPRELPSRGLGSEEGKVAAVHAVAHIEANAVDLAVDAVHRFRDLPDEFYGDWLDVAAEESYHFELLRERLRDLGADYGDLPAHGGLWDSCAATADDPLRRMALVPRVLEARGLDVNPAMIRRFTAAGDEETAAILGVILEDEIGHVAVGDKWFRWLCERRGIDPEDTFAEVLAEAGVEVRPPLNVEARRAAGFSEHELARLSTLGPGDAMGRRRRR